MSSLELRKNVAKIKVLDELNVVVIGLDRNHYETLYNEFGLMAKGYFFNPNYKRGKWDGKKRFFSRNGKTSIHLLPDIIPMLKAMDYKIELIDQRKMGDYSVPLIDENLFEGFTWPDGNSVELGEHQVNGVNSLFENGAGILLAATGAGKSLCTAAILKQYNDHLDARCLVIVPTKDLINQTSSDIAYFDIEVGRFFGDVKEPNKKNVVSTWQSLQNTPKLMTMFDVVVIDECHGAKSSVLKNMLLEYGSNAKAIYGVTGTLPKDKDEAMEVRYVLGDVVYTVPAKELIDKGWLANLKLKTWTLVEDLTPEWNFFKEKSPELAAQTNYKSFKKNFFPEYAAEKAYLHKNKKRVQFIADLISTTVAETGNAFVLVNSVPFGKKLSKEIEGSIFVHGADDSEVRKQIYATFDENDDVVVIATAQLASTGLNIKRIFNLFLIDPGKSFIQIIQSIGRGLRRAKDKDSVTVYDISSDLKYGDRHSKERKKYYKEQSYAYTDNKVEYQKVIDNENDIVVY